MNASDPVERDRHALVLVGALLVCALAFGNTIPGDFVYDDTSQIVANPLIQENHHIVRALTSDVWAFKGNTEQSWSNYWRPTFTGWTILNDRLFGVVDPRGWHVTNILLHAVVVTLAWMVQRGLGASRSLAAAVALLFAVHPAHVESVAWISGSPDLLLAAALLGSWWCLLPVERVHSPLRWGLSLGLYGLGLLSKEVSVLFPLVVFATFLLMHPSEQPLRARLQPALRQSAPFLGLAVLYLLVRNAVLGQAQRAQDHAVGVAEMILSWPSVGLFYFRQVFLPFEYGPSYPIRAFELESGLGGLIGPILGVVAISLVLLWAVRRSGYSLVGLTLFTLLLAPAGNIRVFTAEQVVHDRYLYLPLLGLLMVVLHTVERALVGRFGAVRSGGLLVGLAVVLAVPLTARTIQENRSWTSEVALWERGVQTDPGSMFNHTQLGVALMKQDPPRTDQALVVLDRAIELMPLPLAYQPNAYLERSMIAVSQRRFAAAERDLKIVLKRYPENFAAWERLAIVYQNSKRPEEAEKALRSARENIPYRRAELTDKLAVVLVQQGRRAEALAELESVADRVEHEFKASAKMVLYHRGLLLLDSGDRQGGAASLQRYMELTDGVTDEATVRFREHAAKKLGQL